MGETKKINIVIAGEGGQGVQTIAEIFSRVLFLANKNVTYSPSFGVEQRGTPSLAFINISDSKLIVSDFIEADYIYVMQKRTINKIEKYATKNTIIVFDSSVIDINDISGISGKLYGVPATKIANEKFNPRSNNLIMLGVITRMLDLDKHQVWIEALYKLGRKFKNNDLINQNKEALFIGYDYSLENEEYSLPEYKSKSKTIILKGHGKTGELCPRRCKGCGICILKCPVGALSFNGDFGVLATPIPKVDLERCIACGICRNFCPDGAISIVKK